MTTSPAQTSYVRQVLDQAATAHAAGQPALLFRNELLHRLDVTLTLSWPELRRQVGSLAQNLAELGIGPGDVAASLLPPTPMAVVAFLACASLGATWVACSPAMTAAEAQARLRQARPKLLLCSDGVQLGGTEHDLRPRTGHLVNALHGVREVLYWPYLDATHCAGPIGDGCADDEGARVIHVNRRPPRVHDLRALLADEGAGFEPTLLPPQHPLCLQPAADGTLRPLSHAEAIDAARQSAAELGLAPSAVRPGERLFWPSRPDADVWLRQTGALLNGTTLCLHDGHPAGPAAEPDWRHLWQVAAATAATVFGTSRPHLDACRSAGIEVAEHLGRLHTLVIAGETPDAAAQDWLRQQLPPGTAQVQVGDAAGAPDQNISLP